MTQEQVQRQKSKVRTEETHIEETNSDVSNQELAESTEGVLGSIDEVLEGQLDEELLADIDDVLEENAQAFVEGFVQMGGE